VDDDKSQEEVLNYQPTILVSNKWTGGTSAHRHQHLSKVSLAFSAPPPPPPAEAAGFRTAWWLVFWNGNQVGRSLNGNQIK